MSEYKKGYDDGYTVGHQMATNANKNKPEIRNLAREAWFATMETWFAMREDKGETGEPYKKAKNALREAKNSYYSTQEEKHERTQ